MNSSPPSVEFPDGCVVDMKAQHGAVIAQIDGPEEKRLPWQHTSRLFGGKNIYTGRYMFQWRDVQPLIDFLSGRGVKVRPCPSMIEPLRAEASRLEFEITNLHTRLRMMDGTLRPYQIEGAEFLATNARACIFDEMGLGKTIQALAALPDGAAVMVVCPASLRLTWQAEGKKWRPYIKWNVVCKPQDLQAPRSCNAVICGPETMTKALEQGWLQLDNFEDVSLIVDEAHYYKSQLAKRTVAMKRLAGACRSVWAMTGTPETKDPRDIVGLLRAFGLFNRAFGTRMYFDRQYGSAFDGDQVVFAPEPPHPELVVESLSRVSIRRSRIEVLPEIPRKTYSDVLVDIRDSKVKMPETTAEERAIYKAIEHGGLSVVPPDLLSCLAKCRALLSEAKSGAVKAFVERFVEAGEPLVVGSCNLAPLKLIEEMGYPVISGSVSHDDRTRYVSEFQAGKWPVIGLQTIAGGTGWTLTRAHHMLMVQRDWSPANNTQLEDRICRIGQEADSCVIWDVLANHPLDEIISLNLRYKQTRVDATVNAVRHENTSGSKLVARMRELAGYIQ